MAKAAAKAGQPADAITYEPDAQYRVTLARAVKRAGAVIRPNDHDIVLKGKVCAELGDAIATAVKI